jgi:hypothetical protein
MVAMTSPRRVSSRGVSEMVADPEVTVDPEASSQTHPPTDNARDQVTVLCGLATQASRMGTATRSTDTRAADAPATAELNRS